jgi:predicted DNA-binding antitoxin AbrB/MazE fold protein
MSKSVKYCTVCGEPMIKRPQAIYCSAACQQKAQRNRYKELNENMVSKNIMLKGGIIEKDKKIEILEEKIKKLNNSHRQSIDKHNNILRYLHNELKKIYKKLETIDVKKISLKDGEKIIIEIKLIEEKIKEEILQMEADFDNTSKEIYPLVHEHQLLLKNK